MNLADVTFAPADHAVRAAAARAGKEREPIARRRLEQTRVDRRRRLRHYPRIELLKDVEHLRGLLPPEARAAFPPLPPEARLADVVSERLRLEDELVPVAEARWAALEVAAAVCARNADGAMRFETVAAFLAQPPAIRREYALELIRQRARGEVQP